MKESKHLRHSIKRDLGNYKLKKPQWINYHKTYNYDQGRFLSNDLSKNPRKT
jgi:hypothetical protein